MKIGIDARCLMQDNYSGVSWYTFNLLTALFEIDHENEYILFYNSSQDFKVPDWCRPNVRSVVFKKSNKIFNLSLFVRSQPKLDELIGGVDIFFAPNANFLALSKKCRSIITVHDLSWLRYPEFFTLKGRLWHKAVKFRKNLMLADTIIAVSNSTKNDLVELLKIPAEKIKVIYEGVAEKFKLLDKDSIEIKKVQQKYNLPDKFFLFLGTIEPRKNILGLIKAIKQSKTDYKLVLAGGRGWKSQLIYEIVRNSDKIKLIGYVAEADKPALYNLALSLVYPSYYEGFGLPLVEAMACGCPVVAGANSSQGEVVAEAGLLVDPYNVNEIKKAMEIMAEDVDLRNRLIEIGQVRAKNFSWQKTASEFLELLKK